MAKYLDSIGLQHLWDAFKSRLLPSGGSSGQVLAKASGTDYDVEWITGGGGPGPSPSSQTPEMDGTAAVGTSDDYARADHIHPTDTSRQAALSLETGSLSRNTSNCSSLGTTAVRKYGKVVVVSVYGMKLSSALASGSTSGTLATIPSGYRPAAGMRVPWTSSGAAYGYALVTTAGAITIRNSSASSLATSGEVVFEFVYIIA